MNFMDSLCAKCEHNDWETMREIRAAYKAARSELPKHTWCRITDRPEDVRWHSCRYLGGGIDR